jgi:hypothetical protein
MPNPCDRQFIPSGSTPLHMVRKGDVVVFRIEPPIVFPCHEKVTAVHGADLQQESGSSFQVRMTADYAVIDVAIWCNAIVGDGEGARVCDGMYFLALGKKQFLDRYMDCFHRCLKTKLPSGPAGVAVVISGGSLGALTGGLAGGLVAGLPGALLGAAAGAGVGAIAVPAGVVVRCGVQCFFEVL